MLHSIHNGANENEENNEELANEVLLVNYCFPRYRLSRYLRCVVLRNYFGNVMEPPALLLCYSALLSGMHGCSQLYSDICMIYSNAQKAEVND